MYGNIARSITNVRQGLVFRNWEHQKPNGSTVFVFKKLAQSKMAEEADRGIPAPKGGGPDNSDELWDDEIEAIATKEEGKRLKHADRIDVHVWSEHPEVNIFVDKIYTEHFKSRKAKIERTHVKVVLLDLYVNWSNDQTLLTSYSRNKNDYKAKSIYNSLHISSLTIEVVDTLIEAGFVEQKKGFRNPVDGSGRIARMWPTEKLIKKFREAKFSPFDIWSHEDRNMVILRANDDEGVKGDEIEYEPTPETEAMQESLKAYNNLLRHTFIDIPGLEKPFIEHKSGQGKLSVNQHAKFTRRIFNRGSFEHGGRFWGAWWQTAPKEYRPEIFINDQPTKEVDFSGLHIVMLYGFEGANYWEEIDDDPYLIDPVPFLEGDKIRRAVTKNLMLVLLNAKTNNSAYAAFRDKADAESVEKKLTNIQLSQIQQALEAKHPTIKKYLGSDVSTWLMNKDAQIADIVINEFTKNEIAVLCVHDSFIVPVGHEDYLRETMADAFERVVGVPMMPGSYKAMKESAERIEDLWSRLNMTWMPYDAVPARDDAEQDYADRTKPIRSDRYEAQLKLFREWLEYRAKEDEG